MTMKEICHDGIDVDDAQVIYQGVNSVPLKIVVMQVNKFLLRNTKECYKNLID
ncbi:MAG: hypothetical protein U0L67_07085 [Paludibacteraceae bacterium]|nr:hypothetical protein [Paludibacteraceae bacterium]